MKAAKDIVDSLLTERCTCHSDILSFQCIRTVIAAFDCAISDARRSERAATKEEAAKVVMEMAPNGWTSRQIAAAILALVERET